MAEFEVTTEDANAGKLLPPTWYPFRIKAAEEKPTKAGDSLNTIVDFVGIGGGPAQGVEIREFINHKNPRMGIYPLAAALSGGVLKPGGLKFTPENLVDKELEVYVGQTEYGGKRRNSALDYRPLQRKEAATA